MSMPKSFLRRRGLPQLSVETLTQVISTTHKHFYVGSQWFKMSEKDRISNPPPLDPCPFHGLNCTVGVCVDCWLSRGRKTIQHFMPTLLRKRKFKPQPKPEKNGWKGGRI